MEYQQKIIVNADDFGLNASINAAVMDLAGRGAISSATIMVTRDAGAAGEALDFARRHTGRMGFGLHLDLDDYFHFDETGHFGLNDEDIVEDYRGIVCSRSDDIAHDVRMQIRTLKSAGITPTHIDGHHHVHLFQPLLAEIVIPFLCGEGIGSIRFCAGFFALADDAAAARRALARAGIACTDWWMDLGAVMAGKSPAAHVAVGTGEIMAHVGYPGPGAEPWRVEQYHCLAGGNLVRGPLMSYASLAASPKGGG